MFLQTSHQYVATMMQTPMTPSNDGEGTTKDEPRNSLPVRRGSNTRHHVSHPTAHFPSWKDSDPYWIASCSASAVSVVTEQAPLHRHFLHLASTNLLTQTPLPQPCFLLATSVCACLDKYHLASNSIPGRYISWIFASIWIHSNWDDLSGAWIYVGSRKNLIVYSTSARGGTQ